MMKELFIFPYSGTGLEVLDCIRNSPKTSFISDDIELIGESRNGIEIMQREAIKNNEASKVILVNGSAQTYLKRKKTIEEFNIGSERYATIIHPTAIISSFSKIGKNVFIAAGVIIGPNVIIEDHVIILAGSNIHHDCIIKKYSIICGNVLIAGNVEIGSNCYLGASTSLKNGVKIGENTLIGIGSVVINDIENDVICYGVPAKKQEKKHE
jgi:sugar O-acyltransferase (sialic acid O-acetyltransferase NeuD family)